MISNEASSLAKETALQIAARIADPKELSKLLEAAVANRRSPVGWRATGMSGSAVSVLALMSAAFQATEDPQFAEATLRYLKVVATSNTPRLVFEVFEFALIVGSNEDRIE